MRDWVTSPYFAVLLFLLSPLLTLLVNSGVQKARGWHAARSESTARARLKYYYKRLDEPAPTLLEDLAYIICALPFPLALASIILFLRFAPTASGNFLISVDLAHKISSSTLEILFFCTYLLYAVLTIQGVKVAYRLRHGQTKYQENYKAELQKQIDKLKKKFPKL